MYYSTELYFEPQDIISQISLEGNSNMTSEMTSFDLAFLCGLIKEYRPYKILEVGVSGGGTSAVIMNCLSKLELSAELYSVDLLDTYYRDPRKKMGYLADNVKLGGAGDIKRFKYSGGIAKHIDEIAAEGKIDFLILDTTHCMPGEILDFLVCLPYMKDGGIVVLHDLCANIEGHDERAFATKILYDTVSAKKFYMYDRDRGLELPNIGAFQINEITRKEIINVFSALSISWSYELNEELMKNYISCIKESYPSELYDLFERVVEAQKSCVLKKKIAENYEKKIWFLVNSWKHAKRVVIYGNGYWGNIYLEFARINKLRVDAIAVSNDQSLEDINENQGIPVRHIGDIHFPSDETYFILAVDRKISNTIQRNILWAGYYLFI